LCTYPIYVIFHQADVEVTFEVPSMEGMETLDLALAYDAQKLCSLWGADKKGGVGPFGLWVLASAKLEEKTAVFFRVFRVVGKKDLKPVVLMCTDPTRYVHSTN
jgi:beta-fructofuranosidase